MGTEQHRAGDIRRILRFDAEDKPTRTIKAAIVEQTKTGWIIQPNRQGGKFRPPQEEVRAEYVLTKSEFAEYQQRRQKQLEANRVTDGQRDYQLKQFRRLMYDGPSTAPEQSTPVNNFEIDERALVLPEMGANEYDELVKSIAAVGQLEPVWLYEGKVIDGRHRLRACNQLGIKCSTKQWNGEGGSVAKFIIAGNVNRRNLTRDQKALVALAMLPFLEAEAGVRKRKAGVERAATATRNASGQLTDNLPQACSLTDKPKRNPTAIETAAKVTGANPKDIQVAKRIAVKSPEILEQIKSGATTIAKIKQQTKTPAPAKKINWQAEGPLLHKLFRRLVDAPFTDRDSIIAEAKIILERLQ